MKKIFLVIQREYLTRVKKKTFWLATLLVPIMLVALYVVPIYLSMNSLERTDIIVVDETELFGKFRTNEDVKYHHKTDIDEAKHLIMQTDDYAAIVYIPKTETRIPSDAYLYYYSNSPNVIVKTNIENQLQRILKNNILLEVHQISKEDYEMINNATMHLHSKDLETGRADFLEIKTVLGLVLALLIYFVIFMFGSQVMRGVIEEKNNRIIEVMVSSLRPFQLMMGKIVGIAAVGLTQFVLWIMLSVAAIAVVNVTNADMFAQISQAQNAKNIVTTDTQVAKEASQTIANQLPEITQGLLAIDFKVILSVFVFFFVLGYLLYASLFAAVGAITENESDSQQFILPLTIPLIITIVLSPMIINSPNGVLAQWLSMIPFTSPVAMMLRVPFGLPIWQVWLSLALLLLTFVACTWLAAKIYRTGILMYGKKITYKELWKWLKY